MFAPNFSFAKKRNEQRKNLINVRQANRPCQGEALCTRATPMGRGGVTVSAVNEAVPGLGSAPPWDFRLRPRGGLGEDGKTMMQFRGAPWGSPPQLDSSGRLKPKGPPEFFERYMRLTQLPPRESAAIGKPAGLQGTSFVQCEQNPAVALDMSNHKFKLLMVENGMAKTVGRFHVFQEGMEAISGYNDMLTKGPLGIAGVPGSIGNASGVPGVALLPRGVWQDNGRNRPTIDEGNMQEFQKEEAALAAERFAKHRLGAEMAQNEQVVAEDTSEGKGRHATVRQLATAKDVLESAQASSAKRPGTSFNKIYDERGLTLGDGRRSVEPYSASNLQRTTSSLAVSMARPNRQVSFRNVPFRPATSLLKDKGFWTPGQGGTGRAPDHNKNMVRPDLIASLNARGFSSDPLEQRHQDVKGATLSYK